MEVTIMTVQENIWLRYWFTLGYLILPNITGCNYKDNILFHMGIYYQVFFYITDVNTKYH